MSQERRVKQSLALLAIGLQCCLALGAEPTDEMRRTANTIASLENALAHDDVGRYCDVMHGSTEYLRYVTNVCASAVQNRLRRPEECTPEAAKMQAREDITKCSAMPAAELAGAKSKWREAREGFIRIAASMGFDGERLLKDAQVRR